MSWTVNVHRKVPVGKNSNASKSRFTRIAIVSNSRHIWLIMLLPWVSSVRFSKRARASHCRCSDAQTVRGAAKKYCCATLRGILAVGGRERSRALLLLVKCQRERGNGNDGGYKAMF